MQIVCIKNDHLNKKEKEKEYGCVCPNCKSVFIFNDKDITRPRTINYKNKDCSVKCPNPYCNNHITMDSDAITFFTKDFDQVNFKMKHDE